MSRLSDQARTLASAYEPLIGPPDNVTLTPDQRVIWDALILCRARDEWSAVDLHHLANLVRTLCDLEANAIALIGEEHITVGDKGTKVMNPRHGLIQTLTTRAERLTRLLHMQAAALVNDVTKLAPQRKAEKEARAARNQLDAGARADLEDGLLARPERWQ